MNELVKIFKQCLRASLWDEDDLCFGQMFNKICNLHVDDLPRYSEINPM